MTAQAVATPRRHNGRQNPVALGAAVFAGELLAIADIAPVAALAVRARELLKRHFGADPERAEARLAPDEFRRAARAARRAVADDRFIDRCWHDALAGIGYELSSVYRDRIRLRIVPSRSSAQGRFWRPLPAHRDSWASGAMAQVNWWLPLFPLDAARTLLIWPQAFEQPVANNSAQWDYDVLRSGVRKDYPLLPEATAPPPGRPVAVVVPPGVLLAFSAAHLHAGCTDASGITRFCVDTRTVWHADIEARRGAPDVDGAGCAPRWEMFGCERVPGVTGDGARPSGGAMR